MRKTLLGVDYHKEQDQQGSLFSEAEISLTGNTNKKKMIIKQNFTEEIYKKALERSS